MALTKAQTALYWRTWGSISAALLADLADVPDADKKYIQTRRRPCHAQAGCPLSSKDWTNRHLSLWLLYESRVTDPSNLTRHMALEEQAHPEAGRIYRIRQLLTQLGKPTSYAAACAHDQTLSPNLCNWPATSLQTALQALQRTARAKPGATRPETGF
jgi:hypothetical protein